MDVKFEDAIQAGKISGVILCATNSKGDFALNKPIGHRTLLSGENKPLDVDDVLYLASATKLVTTVAALQCVEDGLLTLDGDVSTLAPKLGGNQVFVSGAADSELEPQSKPVTLRQLITHSAGLSYAFMDPLIAAWQKEHPPSTEPRTLEEKFEYPLTYQPGQGWMYGTGLDWAGRLVEIVTGKTLEEYVNTRILRPLGLKEDASFFPVTREDLRARMVDLNPNDPNGYGMAVVGGQVDMIVSGKGDFGGHGLFISSSHYIKILQSLLANDGKLLRTETVLTMAENHLSPEALTSLQQAATNHPAAPFMRVGVDEGVKIGFGLGGLVTLEDIDGWYGANTLSWGGGLTFAWFVDRKNDLCGLAAIQSTLPVDVGVVTELKQVFRKGIYAEYKAWKDRA